VRERERERRKKGIFRGIINEEYERSEMSSRIIRGRLADVLKEHTASIFRVK
jgi:hypothetical protein